MAQARTETTPSNGPKSDAGRPTTLRRRFQLRTLRDRVLVAVVVTGLAIALGGALLLGRAALAVRDLERNQYAGMASETRMRLDRLVNRDRSRLIEAAYSDPLYALVGRGPAPPDSMIHPPFRDQFPSQFGDRFVAVYDLGGKALYRWTDESLPDIEKFVAGNALFRMLDNREPTIGLLRNGDELYWVGGVPVLPTNFTDQSQPIRGYVVVAQRFNPATLAPGSGDRSARFELAPLANLKTPFQTRVDAAGGRDSVRVTFSLPDVFAQQTTLATLTTGRAEYRTIESTLRWLMLAVLIGAVGIAGGLFVTARRVIVEPVSRLSAAMVPSQNSPFPSLIGSVSTAKEWNRLTGAINRLLTYSRGSQDRLDRLTGVTADGAFERDLTSGEWTISPRFRQLLGLAASEPLPASLSDKLVPDESTKALMTWLEAETPEPRSMARSVTRRAGGQLRFEATVGTDAAGAPNRVTGRISDPGAEVALQEALARIAAERDAGRAAQGRFLAAIANSWSTEPTSRAEALDHLKTIGAGLEGRLAAQPDGFDLYALFQELASLAPGADLQIVPGVPEQVEGDRRMLRSVIVAFLGTTQQGTRVVLRADQPNRLEPDFVRIAVEDHWAIAAADVATVGRALETGDTDGSVPLLEWRAVHFLAKALGGTAALAADGGVVTRSLTLPLRQVAAPTPAAADLIDPVTDPALWASDHTEAVFNEPTRESDRPSRAEPVVQLVADASVTIDFDRDMSVDAVPIGARFAADLTAGTEDALRTARIAIAEVPARLTELRGGVRAGEARTAIENAVAIERVGSLLGATELAHRCRDLIDAAEHSYLDTAEQLLAGLELAWHRTSDALGPAMTVAAPEAPAIDPATLEQLMASLGEGALGTQLVTLFLGEAPERIEAIGRAASSGNLAELSTLADDLKGMCGLVGALPMTRQCDLARSADGPEAVATAVGGLRHEWERVQRLLDQLTSARIGA